MTFHSFATVALFLVIAGPSQGQNITGRWEWHEVAVKDKPQTRFSLMILRKGNVVRGVYSVDEFINGEWQGEDGNQTPFVGLVQGQNITVKFDPLGTVPGYQQNVRYEAPKDGRLPSTTQLVLKGRTLRWRITRGDKIEGLPNTLELHRERHR